MAQWLKDHLPEITEAFITRSAPPDVEAKNRSLLKGSQSTPRLERGLICLFAPMIN